MQCTCNFYSTRDLIANLFSSSNEKIWDIPDIYEKIPKEMMFT